jgi:hypothetical protein
MFKKLEHAILGFVYIGTKYMMIRLWKNKFFYLWFDNSWMKMVNEGRPKKYQHKRGCITNYGMRWTCEANPFKHLSDGLDNIIDKFGDKMSPEQKQVTSGYRTLMNRIINYENSEWK